MANFTFRGLIAPVLTAFNNDATKSLNLGVISSYAKHLKDRGIQGILVNGTSGEGMSLNAKERKQTAEAWISACKQNDQHVMIQVGGTNLPDVLELARHAEKNGANSLLCLPELYLKPTTCGDLENYLQIVGRAAPNTPLLYYHFPRMTNVHINMGQFLNTINSANVPTFSGIKFTSTLIDEGLAAVNAQRQTFSVFLGPGDIALPAYAVGFNSSIQTPLNVFPELCQSILTNVQNGDVEEARVGQKRLNGRLQAITRNGGWVPGMKAAMGLLTPIDLGPSRTPLKDLTADAVRQLEAELKTL